jgi:citrate lyase subunit beta/citryl-CoA lyase
VATIATTGNKGKGIRSDCQLTLEIRQSGGIDIQLVSKVKSMYGESILRLCNEILKFYGITDARLEIEDSGALEFVIAARLEASLNFWNRINIRLPKTATAFRGFTFRETAPAL